jgi:SPP1 family predicted phage head-tail adaptor
MGHAAESWAKIDNGDDWMRIWTLRGEERLEALQNNQRIEFEGSIRYRADLTERHRIYYSSTYYQLEGLVNVGMRNIELRFMAKAVI